MPLAPDVSNYMLGRGILYFAQFDDNGNQLGELDLGNCSSFALTLDTTKLAHYSARQGLRVKDKEVVTELNATGSFTMDEYSKENLCLALFGTTLQESQSTASVTDEAVTAYVDRWVKLANRSVSSVVVTDSSGSTTYVENTDYRIDATTGRLFILSSGSITDGQDILVDYSAAALTYDSIRAFTKSSVEGFLRFVGNNQSGPNYEAEIWKCSLSPNGDINFLAEEWGSIAMNLNIEKDETNHPNEPYFRLILVE